MKKSKEKHRAIAPVALGGCGGLGQLWEALAELWEALGELWEGQYKEKLSCVMRAAGPSEIKVAPAPPTPPQPPSAAGSTYRSMFF